MAGSGATLSANEVLFKFGFIDDMQLINLIDPPNDDGAIISIQETRLGPNYDLSLLQMEGYKFFSQHKRPECNYHGGLMIYVDEKVDAYRLEMSNISTL